MLHGASGRLGVSVDDKTCVLMGEVRIGISKISSWYAAVPTDNGRSLRLVDVSGSSIGQDWLGGV